MTEDRIRAKSPPKVRRYFLRNGLVSLITSMSLWDLFVRTADFEWSVRVSLDRI